PIVLRFSEHAPHRLGASLPAMIAPITDVNGRFTGTHATYLRADGSNKADLPKQYQRETRGVIGGGAVRPADYDPARPLLVAEGLETVLSAMAVLGLPAGWSAVYAGGLRTVELPTDVRHITIGVDHDLNGTGQRNALAAYDRWTVEGRTVRI